MKFPKIILSTAVFIIWFNSIYAGWIPAERISDENIVYTPRIASHGQYLHVVYIIWIGTDHIYYLRSDNHGLTWDEPYLMMDTSLNTAGLFPTVRTNGDSVFAIWSHYFRNSDDRTIAFRRSLNNGLTWQPVVNILPPNEYYLQKHAFCISGRNIYVIYNHYDGDLIYEFVKSTNGGQTWSEPEELFRAYQSGWFDIACRGDTIHFIWSGNYALHDSWETYYTRSTNSGNSWSESQLLTEPDTIGSQHPSLSINEDGEIVVCWTDGKYSPHPWNGDLLVRYSYDSGDSWTDEEQITFDHWARVPRIVWNGDSIHIVWQDDRYGYGSTFYMMSPDNGITWGDEVRLDNDPARSEYPDIAVSDSSRHVVWKDNRDYPGGVYYSRWEPEVSIEESLPHDYHVELTAYPNPFNSTTVLTYKNLEGGDIDIYDITGKLVKTLNAGGIKEGQVTWDATDAAGEKVCSGIYFARAMTANSVKTAKLIFLK